MDSNIQASADARPSRLAFRFSLFALFLFVTLICVLLAWWVQPRQYIVESMFHLAPAQPGLLGETSQPFDPQEFARFCQTHHDLIHTEMVIMSALRDPQIAALPMVRVHADPVAWLREEIEVETSDKTQLLSIRLLCPEGAVDDCRRIVDAISDAYLKEVVFDEEQRQLVLRDAVSRSVDSLREKLIAKISEVKSIGGNADERNAADKVAQLEIEAMVETWRKLFLQLQILDLNSVAPDRVRLIQKAVSRPK
ncbi:MAG: hypothetical protein WD971_14625 [Pirellulales bacterium]